MTIQEIGVVGLVAAAFALWGRVQFIWTWLKGLILVERQVSKDLASLLLLYLHHHGKRKGAQSGLYDYNLRFIRPLGKAGYVFFELLAEGPARFRRGLVFFWFRPESARGAHQLGRGEQSEGTFTFLRGSVDWPAFLLQVGTWQDEMNSDNLSLRHGVQTVVGRLSTSPNEAPTNQKLQAENPRRNRCVYVRWTPEDLEPQTETSLADLSLRPEIVQVTRDFARIIEDREWFESHLVPWRHGWFFHGPPGTGKSTLVRCLGQKHDLPVYRIDLGSLTNQDFLEAWGGIQSNMPCIALMEDIDAVYGPNRTLKVPGRGPSFDCLLNCLSGAESSSGIFVFVTSNHPEKLDPALHRGGRLDRTVEFKGLDKEGKEKMVRRILDHDDDIQRVLKDLSIADLAPADLQNVLCKLAFKRRYGEWEEETA